jgi:hypothetical protein
MPAGEHRRAADSFVDDPTPTWANCIPRAKAHALPRCPILIPISHADAPMQLLLLRRNELGTRHDGVAAAFSSHGRASFKLCRSRGQKRLTAKIRSFERELGIFGLILDAMRQRDAASLTVPTVTQ